MLKHKRSIKAILFAFVFLALFTGVSSINQFVRPVQAANCAAPTTDYGSATLSIPDSLPGNTTYKAWVRMRAADTTNNSVNLEVAGNCFDAGDGGTPAIGAENGGIATTGWSWVDYQNGNTASKMTFTLPTGTGRTFRLVGREPGVAVDRVLFLLSTDTCQPNNTRDTSKTPPVEPGDSCLSAPTQMPTVSMTAPTNGQTFTLPAGGGSVAIPLSATTTKDPSLSVSKVEYFNGLIKIGESSTGPGYSTSWPVTAAGNYGIASRVTDSQGQVATSQTVNITVTAPVGNPTVAITSPANNANFTAGSLVTIAATPTANGGRSIQNVVFKQNGTTICTDTTSPYQCTTPSPLSAGSGNTNQSYTFQAVVTDSASATGSAQINVNVAPPPSVTITSPANNATVSVPGSVVVSANPIVAPGFTPTVRFFVDGAQVGNAVTAAPFTSSAIAINTVKSYNISASVTDNVGATSSTAITVRGVDTTAPSVPTGLTAALGTATNTVNLSWTRSSQTDTAKYSIVQTDTNGGATVTYDTQTNVATYVAANVSAGHSYTYKIAAVDTSGNTSAFTAVTQAVTIPNAADTTPPCVPHNLRQDPNKLPTSTSISLLWDVPTSGVRSNGQACDATVVGYHITRVNTSTLLPNQTAPSITDTGLTPNVTYQYQLVAYDAANNGSDATTISVKTVSLPVATITAPANNASFTTGSTVALTATAAAFDGTTVSRVEFLKAGSTTVVASVNAPGPFTTNLSGLAAGSYSYQARVVDNRGDVGPLSTVNFTVAAAAVPAVNLSYPPLGPTTGYYYDGNTVALSATATLSGGATINQVVFKDNGAIVPGCSFVNRATSYSCNVAKVTPGTHIYTATVTDSAGRVGTSAPAAGTIAVRIKGDVNGDNAVDTNDYFLFLADYRNQNNLRSDFDRSGTVDSNDYFVFLSAYYKYNKIP